MAAAIEASSVMRADNKRLSRDLAKSRSMFKRTFGRIGRGIKSSLKGVLSPIGVGAGVAGLVVVGREVLAFEQSLDDVAIQGDVSEKKMAELRATIDRLSREFGISRNVIAGASLELVNLLGASGASAETLEVLTRAAFATGAPVEELAGLVLSLRKQFGIAEDDAVGLEAALGAIILAGKKGSIPLGEMNLILQQTSAQFKEFSAAGTAGVAQLAATLQILRNSFGSAAEAGTGLNALLGVITTREVQLAEAGVNIRDANGEMRNLLDIVEDIDKAGIVKDPAKFNRVFGTRKEARRSLLAPAPESVPQPHDDSPGSVATCSSTTADLAKLRRRSLRTVRSWASRPSRCKPTSPSTPTVCGWSPLQRTRSADSTSS